MVSRGRLYEFFKVFKGFAKRGVELVGLYKLASANSSPLFISIRICGWKDFGRGGDFLISRLNMMVLWKTSVK